MKLQAFPPDSQGNFLLSILAFFPSAVKLSINSNTADCASDNLMSTCLLMCGNAKTYRFLEAQMLD